MATAEEVEMKMRNRFSAIGSVIDDETVAGLIKLQLAGDFLGCGKELVENRVIFGGDGGMAGVVLLGDE